MNKNAIQKFAIWARNELIAQVSQRAYQYGIDESGFGDASADTLNGRLLTAEEKSQRQELIKQIKEKGYQQVMEEVAYTWFNRFIALRFMEVNNYLPSHIRVFSDASGAFKPEILNDVLHLDLPGLSSGKVAEYIESNDTEALYRYLLLTQCNALNSALPVMFERMGGYTEMLLPNNILRQDSVLGHMVSDIPEEDWQDAVQIIGWLYQYYNTELNAVVYDGNMSKSRIPKELLPAATTIYTPDWAIRYMVENSLGRLWLERLKAEAEDGTLHIPAGVPIRQEGGTIYVDSASEQDADDNFASYFKTNWKYYLDEAKQEPDVEAQLREIRKSYKDLNLKDIKVIDPCMGSGHILVYAFDVLMQIYTSAGWDQREAAQSILKNNLFGLDIDDRAAQLAYFAVMMKARQYDRRLLTRGIQPHIHSIIESNSLGGAYKLAMGDFLLSKEHQETLNYLLDAFVDAKEYGSILCLEKRDYVGLLQAWNLTASQTTENFNLTLWFAAVEHEIPKLIEQAIILTQGYDVVMTNPPYLGSSRFSTKLNDFVIANYPDVKADLSMVMFKHALRDMCKKNGFVSFITTTSWMFLSSFEKLRSFVLAGYDFESLVDFGTELFEGKVGHNPIVAWVNRKSHTDHAMTGIRLVDYCYSRRDEKETEFFNKKNYHYPKQSNFSKIPKARIGYWISNKMIGQFSKKPISKYADTRRGLQTGNSEKFIRKWYEVLRKKEALQLDQNTKKLPCKWFLFNSGGSFRRWYGNIIDVVNWEDSGRDIKNTGKAIIPSEDRYFDELISWNKISSGQMSVRYQPKGIIPGDASPFLHSTVQNHEIILYAMAMLNSKIAAAIVEVLSPTLNFEVGNIAEIPVVIDDNYQAQTLPIVNSCVEAAKSDWDSYETSWDFKRHPLV